MKVIIDIPEERYRDIQRIAEVQLKRRTQTAEQIIANGTPLRRQKMTNKEAIEVLSTYDMSEDNEDKEFIEAIKMAIKALEQDPCEDAISRQAESEEEE